MTIFKLKPELQKVLWKRAETGGHFQYPEGDESMPSLFFRIEKKDDGVEIINVDDAPVSIWYKGCHYSANSARLEVGFGEHFGGYLDGDDDLFADMSKEDKLTALGFWIEDNIDDIIETMVSTAEDVVNKYKDYLDDEPPPEPLAFTDYYDTL